MPKGQKIATCCYCGTRAVMRFDQERHELVCSACGAPLHNMKFMPQRSDKTAKSAKPSERRAAYAPSASRRHPVQYEELRSRPRKRPKRRIPIFRRVIEELWDEIEDIFD